MGVRINGKSYSGNNIVIVNGKVISGGESQIAKLEITYEDGSKETEVLGKVDNINIEVQGDVHGDVQCSQGDIQVGGSVGGQAKTSQGDIDVEGHVNGGVKTSQGDIKVGGSVTGDARTSLGDAKIYNK